MGAHAVHADRGRERGVQRDRTRQQPPPGRLPRGRGGGQQVGQPAAQVGAEGGGEGGEGGEDVVAEGFVAGAERGEQRGDDGRQVRHCATAQRAEHVEQRPRHCSTLVGHAAVAQGAQEGAQRDGRVEIVARGGEAAGREEICGSIQPRGAAAQGASHAAGTTTVSSHRGGGGAGGEGGGGARGGGRAARALRADALFLEFAFA